MEALGIYIYRSTEAHSLPVFGQQVVHEADMIEVLKTRPDFCYLCDVAPKD